MQFVIIFMRK